MCGWGRCARFFMRDLEHKNIYGVDVLKSAVDICLESRIPGQFSVIGNHPPLDFPTGSFDVIYAFSVFSHLPKELARNWVAEFARLLRPNGLLLVTTQGRGFIEFCASFRGRENAFLWHRLLANSFVDTQKALEAYDRGEFLYEPNGGGDNPELGGSVYGDTLIPRKYIEQEWTKSLSFRDFIDDPAVLPQALIVMQKSQ
ncbi:MAG: class I SAM-dependent methyltransferase [Blastocatellia bacterium]